MHTHTGTALATLMWLWVMYRAKEDGAVVLVRVCLSVPRLLRVGRPKICCTTLSFTLEAPTEAKAHLLFFQGLVHPWDAHGHDDDGTAGYVFAKSEVGAMPSLESVPSEEEH